MKNILLAAARPGRLTAAALAAAVLWAAGGWAAGLGRDDRWALAAVGRGDEARVRALLRLAVAPGDSKLRVEARAALAELPAEAAPTLLDVWHGGEDERQRDAAVDALAAHNPSQAVTLLRGEIGRSKDLNRRLNCLYRVGALHVPEAGKVLRECLDDGDPVVRDTVCHILRTYRPDDAASGVATAAYKAFADDILETLRKRRAEDPDARVREHANCAVHILSDDRLPDRFRENGCDEGK
jgi:HEAT repeat protein